MREKCKVGAWEGRGGRPAKGGGAMSSKKMLVDNAEEGMLAWTMSS